MTGYEVAQGSASYPLVFLLVQSSDHITGATGLAPAVTISKNGGAFAAPSGAVSEVGNGWYKVAGNATDTATLGPILLHAAVATADPCDVVFPVVAVNPQSAAYGLVLAKGANLTGLNDIAATAIVSGGAIATAGGAVSTVTATGSVAAPVTVGTNNDKTGYSLVVSPPTAAAIAAALWSDVTAGDFAAVGSPGHVLVGQLGGAFTGTSSVYSAAALANSPAGGGSAPTAAQIATALWTDTTSGDFSVPGSSGAALFVAAGYGPKRNEAVANFPFQMLKLDGTVAPGLTVASTAARDGGAPAATTNAARETGGGWYLIDLSAADMNGNAVTLTFGASGAQTLSIVFLTQP